MSETQIPTQKSKRRRRFIREPEFRSEKTTAGRLVLTERDLDILTFVAHHRFASSAQICRVFTCDCPEAETSVTGEETATRRKQKVHRDGCCDVKATPWSQDRKLYRDRQHVVSRLAELFHGQFLARPSAQRDLVRKLGKAGHGSIAMVYHVTERGLAEIGDERRAELGYGRLSWAKKVDEGKHHFMEHTLAIGDFSVGLDCAVRVRPGLKRASERSLLSLMSETQRKSSRPFAMRPRVGLETLTTVPDLAFAIGDARSGSAKSLYFMLELDLGSMPLERSDLTQTSLLRKIIGYARAYKDREDEKLGWRGYRVVILTTTAERCKNAIEAAQRGLRSNGLWSASKIFRFGTLAASADPLSFDYLDIEGEAKSLLGLDPVKSEHVVASS